MAGRMSDAASRARVSVGIDVGGTFTDLVAVDAGGAIESRKVLSTPTDQSAGVLDALAALGRPAHDIERIAHGTTVATNTLLERTGARVVLCATEGATDLLELARQDRASLYDLRRHWPAPLVPPERVVAVAERIAPEGVLRGLSTADARAVAARVAELEPEVVAVSLLHSYLDASHERLLAAELARALPGVDIVPSSDVLPEIREYERTATTVAEAYLRPGVSRYVRQLARALDALGYPPLDVMTSTGGMRSASDATRGAASLALSGPAGGVVGAAYVAEAAGWRMALTIDIGGTSADAGVIVDCVPLSEAGGAIAGVPIALPRVLIETVSAGGGSVGWIDDGGALRVGPRSAGAQPGPAAFGRGGVDATVTDAHVVVGNVRTGQLSGGISLDHAAALASIERLAARLGAPAERVAESMIGAADAAMARALRRVSVERGIDPRACALVAFGGGGPLHGCALAEQLGMRVVLVPPFAGVLSALGLSIAAERREALASVMRPLTDMKERDLGALHAVLAERAGAGGERRSWLRARYVGQGHELEIPFQPAESSAVLIDRFHAHHTGRYGFTLDRAVEVVSARHAAIGASRAIDLTDARIVRRGGDRQTIRGRATVALPDATLLVAAGWTARAMTGGGWIVERDA